MWPGSQRLLTLRFCQDHTKALALLTPCLRLLLLSGPACGHKLWCLVTTEKTFATINIAASAYQIELYKFSSVTQLPLGGATFGLFNEHGVLITKATTEANGKLVFQTDVAQGIILREHQLYYVQELRAPPGYQLDNTKHWLCFCNEAGESCSDYTNILTGFNAIRIPAGQNGNLHIENKPQAYYTLPGTGGPGIYPLMLVSVIFIITPLVYMSILRRKRERRGVG